MLLIPVNNLLNKVRREFYTNFIQENSGDQRRLFRASKRLLNVSRDDGLPPNLHARLIEKESNLQGFSQEIYMATGPEKTKYCFNVSKSTSFHK